MSEKGPRQRIKRKKYLVDWRHQLATTAQLLGVLFGVGLLYAIGLLVLPGPTRLSELSTEEATQVLLRANAIYFALGAAILGVLSILLTHRVAGPAIVLERAVEGMRKGEYAHRLSLRRRDYLQDLASSLDRLRGELKARQEQMKSLLSCLDEKDLDGAREIAQSLVPVNEDEKDGDAPEAAKTNEDEKSAASAEEAETAAT